MSGAHVEPVSVDNAPAILSGGLAIFAAVLAVLTTGLVSLLSLIMGVLGLGLLGIGLFALNSRAAVSLGTGLVFFGVVIGGGYGAQAEFVLVGLLGSVLAWDLGHNSIVIGRQLGRDAATFRLELFHALGSLSVGVGAVVALYGLYLLIPEGQPVSALAFLLLGALVLALVVRR